MPGTTAGILYFDLPVWYIGGGFHCRRCPCELEAMKGRKTLGPVDIEAVLTKVAQAQQKLIREQQKINSELEKKIAELEKNSR